MVFTRFVEIGRVAMINFGQDFGKLCVIVNIVDTRRVLVDGPETGVSRQVIGLKRLSLTDMKVPILQGARPGTVKAAMKKANIVSEFATSQLGKKLALQATRAAATDFDKFKIMVAKKTRSAEIRKKLAASKPKKAAKTITDKPKAAVAGGKKA
jgi:large subunit ribosomal protein L14e